MATRRITRSVVALGLSGLLLATALSASAAAQDPTAAFTPESTAVSADPGTADPAAPGADPVDDAVDDAQSYDETTPPSSRRLATENRRVLAIIGALVLVALALALLTVRYWRVTKPLPLAADEPVGAHEPVAADAPVVAAAPGADDAPVADDLAEPVEPATRRGRRSRRAVAGADHAGADDDWEPHATGEHAQVNLAAVPATVRPDVGARRRALGLPADG